MKEQQQQPRETKSFNLNHRKPGWRLAVRGCGLLATLALALAIAPRAQANITVTTLNDSGSGSLRQAIVDAAPGDTIDFAVTGTITLTSGQLVIGKDLTISGPGATSLKVSGNNSSRVFLVTNVISSISGLTIANGRLPSGTGDQVGAGICNWSVGALTISNCVITSNTNAASGGLGGIGGGIFNWPSTLTIINSTISRNYALYGGGIENQGALKLISSTISENYVISSGGGVRTGGSGGSLMATNVTISGNGSFYSAGGILQPLMGSDYSPTLWLVDSTVCSNFSVFAGGVAGGIEVDSGAANIRSTMVAANRAQIAPDCYTFDFEGRTITSHDYNLIGNTNGATITGVTTHNIYGKDPLLGPLADNGGPTPTHALLPGSPAIDHGSSGGLATDQRGQPRIFNFPAYFDAADGSDIGAYELQERAQTGPVFTVNSNDDVDDGVPGIAHCSLREAINAANTTPGTNTINFATAIPGLMNGVTGTITLANGQLTVTNSVNINGPGAANLTVSGNNASQVFRVTGGAVLMANLTVSNGLIPSGDHSPTNQGAGIYNSATLAINKCVVRGNTNLDSRGYGGGVFTVSTLAIANTTISDNFGYAGGGICQGNQDGGPWVLQLINSTLVNNQAFGGAGGLYAGGVAMITNTTFSGNGSMLFAGDAVICNSTIVSNGVGIQVSTGRSLHIRSSIVAGNGYDCRGDITSDDYNLIQNPTGAGIVGATTHNIYNQDPKLGPLADLGGPTPTHALRFDSPALDAGNSGGLTTDQRGLPRPIDDPNIANAEGGDGSDIGAYEADPNLRITGFGKTGGDIWLSFNSILGRTYRVESTDELPPTWNILTNGVPGTGGRFQALDGGAASLPKRFYRTVLVLP